MILEILNGGGVEWRGDPSFEQGFVDQCREEGVTGVVYTRLKEAPDWNGCPAGVRRHLVAYSLSAEQVREIVDSEIARIVGGLAPLGVTPLLFKGCALAHTLYPEPWLRLGCDSDLLIDREDSSRVTDTLLDLGYRTPGAISGEVVMNQAAFYLESGGITVAMDVHWELSQAQVLIGRLPYPELLDRSIVLEGWRQDVEPRAFCRVDSLLLASMHRAREYDRNRLIWLYDIHLLAESLSAGDVEDLEQRARSKEVAALVADGLRQAQTHFRTRLPEGLLDRLCRDDPFRTESSARLLSERRRADRMITDFAGTRGWRNRLRLAREHLLPPSGYLLEKYSRTSRLWLPFLYVRRLLEGIPKMLRPRKP